MFNPSSPITGGAQTGFTTPTYSFVSDVAPDSNGKQVAFTALGGTQAGVTLHSVASPFTSTFVRPRTFKVLGQPNPVSGRIANVPRNTYKLLTRKGVTPLAGQPVVNAQVSTTIDIPAGSDLADPANLRAMLSAHIGMLTQLSAELGNTVTTGIM